MVLSLLAHLASNPGRLVTKEELVTAVWKGQEVSDEVIARAVMKARRAIDDSARTPTHIFTEAGRGYRFDPGAPVSPNHSPSHGSAATASAAPSAAPVGVTSAAARLLGAGSALGAVWRVLPFANRSENAALNWTVTGLQRLLHHAMETAAHVTAVTSDPADDAPSAQAGLPSSRVARASALRPVDSVVTGDIEEKAPAGFQLSIAWKVPGQVVQTLVLDGPELPPLVLRAAGSLAPPAPWQAEVARRNPKAWANLSELIAHLHRWPRAEVVQRLQRCYNVLPRLPQLLLQQAELLLQMGDFERAEAVGQEAQVALGQGPEEEQLELLLSVRVLLNEAAKRRGDLQLTRERIALSLELIGRHEGKLLPSQPLSRLWAQAGFLHREAGDFTGAAAFLERAVLVAIRAGLLDAELRYRAVLSQLLSWQGEPHRAEDTLRQVIGRASEAGDRTATSNAMCMLAAIAHDGGRLGSSVHWSEKALAVGLGAVADASFTANSRATLIEAYISHGNLPRAERTLQWRRRHKPAGSATIHELGVLSKTAWLFWRQGRLEESAACYRQVLQDRRLDVWVKWANYLRSEYAILLSLLGRPDEGRAELDQLPSIVLPAVVARAQAALAISQGRRDEARATLAELMPRIKLGEPEAHLPVMDLAWLLMEDGEDSEAEFLLERNMVTESDTSALRWILLALQDRLYGDVPASEWSAARDRSPGLIRHCPALGSPDDVLRRREGRAERLPNLLTALSW